MPSMTSAESVLQALRRKVTLDPILFSIDALKRLWAKEAPLNDPLTNQPIKPPYAVIDWALGNPDWATGTTGPVEHTFSIICYTATDTEAFAVLRKLIDAFDGKTLDDPAFNAMMLVGQDVGKDGPLVWYATIDLEISMTEVNGK